FRHHRKVSGGPNRIPHDAGRAHRRARPFASLRNVHGAAHAADRGLPPEKGQAGLIGRAPLGALALLVALAPAAAPANTPPPRFAQAVEFPYYLSPRNLWEQELVWIKSI